MPQQSMLCLCYAGTLILTHLSGEGCWIQHQKERAFEGAWPDLLLWPVQQLCNLQLPWSRYALQLTRSHTAWTAWSP